jgi:multicomponent Na+:H+ antiporter subunit E
VTGEGRGARLRSTLPLLLWLVLVWNLLWGTWSWANLLSGIVVALLVTLLLPLPPVAARQRLRPLWALVYLWWFLVDLVLSCAQVLWLAFAPGQPRGALVEVPVRTDNDLLLTMLAETVTLIPGSIVLELDRERQVLGLHLLNVRDHAAVADQKRRVLVEEERIVRAFGSAEDLARLGLRPGAGEKRA